MRRTTFDARNTQFSGLYFPDCLPVYEASTSSIIEHLVGDTGVFFDVGANWGWYSVLIATRPSYKGTIHAFEPFPPNFTDLTKMIAGAGLDDRVFCHAIALGDSKGEAVMSMPDGIHTGLAQVGKEKTGIKVPLMRLDDLDLPAPRVVKIDVEGYELMVLKGAKRVIETARPFIIFESGLNPSQQKIIFDTLRYVREMKYILFYPGIVMEDPDYIIHADRGFIPESGKFALVPFLPAHRSHLESVANIIATPRERFDEFKACFAGLT
jgi:FkbM family methyltransferase